MQTHETEAIQSEKNDRLACYVFYINKQILHLRNNTVEHLINVKSSAQKLHACIIHKRNVEQSQTKRIGNCV